MGMFLGLSQDQTLGQLRLLLTNLGTIAVMLGVVKPDVVGGWTTAILGFSGAAMILGGMVWSAIDKMRASTIKKIDEMAKDPTSPVVGVIMTNNVEGRELAQGLPGNTTVTAGTVEAAQLARAA